MDRYSPGTPRPLWRVILLSAVTLFAYYGYYKWVIQDELRRYNGDEWFGAVSLIPFGLGVTLPPVLAALDPDVPQWFAWLSFLGIAWIYVVQFKLYRTVNRMYRESGMKEPLIVWWLFVPGLNLVVGLRQIHFLSQYWAMKQNKPTIDPIAKAFPVIFATLVCTILMAVGTPSLAIALPMAHPVLATGSLFSFSGDRPIDLGVNNGLLAPCPTSPNCVSSQSNNSEHRIEPLRFNGSPTETMQALKSIVQDLPRTNIVSESGNYLYVEFTSAFMGFVDDVEFYINPTENVVQVRSASRLGESDLGVNRKRIETIRKQLAELNGTTES